MSHRSSRQLRVSGLARVEGEGALNVSVRDGKVEHAELRIYEPPRFFEAFLRGRAITEPPDITARICGICPVAYQMSACRAIEDACGVSVDGQIAALRRLLYCGEWISSHALHIYLLHAPDFLGYPDAMTLAKDHRETVERGLALKKAGNTIMTVVGGRAIHPVNVRLGGFYRAPVPGELAPLAEQLRRALDQAIETVRWVSGFEFPDLRLDHEFLALREPDQYAIDAGVPHTSGVASWPLNEFSEHVVEEQVPHSTALHARLDGHPFLVGPLARYSLNSGTLSPVARQAAEAAGLGPVCRNPFQGIIVRAVEIVYAVEEALRLIDSYDTPERSYVDVEARPGAGHGATEAPRGTLYHRYEIDQGLVTSATIVPPTAQNQAAIEEDLVTLINANLHLDDSALTALCEQAIRNYDPCISCAAHFLDLTVDRR
ncbi:Ni/Fe hydrogenase subunit alpha [Kibdelosporangium philippinense]|uniref:Ni/Fe hydrogenase subunit alpha n=1 Tax=Kibdelosporangium philippinense TaxID=211113 RepID=A0ABS8Z9X7_9PSEU|nr:Ni/Fe hydrogenase subunit alpha [Kibdelosporangium philippinense]MCE7004665.1 Ni/Fe hydrogenase subunit alpha [Kibdelosporangium philippinense]